MAKRKKAQAQMSFDDRPTSAPAVRKRGYRARKYRAGGRTKARPRPRDVRSARARKKARKTARTCTTVHVKAHTRKCPSGRKRSSSKGSSKGKRSRMPRRNKKGQFIKL